MAESKIMNYLETDEELISMRKRWKESGIKEPFPPFNYDEYSGMTDYKNKIQKQFENLVSLQRRNRD